MSEKTLGQIAYEAAQQTNGCLQPWAEANQRKWEAAANAVADQCAKVAEAAFSKTHAWKTEYFHQDDVKAGRLAAVEEVSAEIRALKSPVAP